MNQQQPQHEPPAASSPGKYAIIFKHRQSGHLAEVAVESNIDPKHLIVCLACQTRMDNAVAMAMQIGLAGRLSDWTEIHRRFVPYPERKAKSLGEL